MFEQPSSQPAPAPVPAPASARVLAPEGEPIEFLYKGRLFHVHGIVSRWRESGGWWNRIDDGQHLTEENIFDDGARAIWRVEAAPVGALATFEVELDESTKSWQIRPTSRPA